PGSVRMLRSRLAVAEFRTVQKHPEVSYQVLRPLRSVAPILPAIRYHHERMNGSGYPEGLKGDKIPLGASIIAVADSYDAMTHDRPHRPAMTPLQAMMELRRCTPAGYDGRCVDAMAEIVNLPDLEMTIAGQRELQTVSV
ncbi:MAG TPA: HD domain-containing phosphohydrolase, partial [Phycisphaerae bacterium]|nr:HD domain-containing phosphohydrolase [Phycisphaerae bacterium]